MVNDALMILWRWSSTLALFQKVNLRRFYRVSFRIYFRRIYFCYWAGAWYGLTDNLGCQWSVSNSLISLIISCDSWASWNPVKNQSSCLPVLVVLHDLPKHFSGLKDTFRIVNCLRIPYFIWWTLLMSIGKYIFSFNPR